MRNHYIKYLILFFVLSNGAWATDVDEFIQEHNSINKEIQNQYKIVEQELKIKELNKLQKLKPQSIEITKTKIKINDIGYCIDIKEISIKGNETFTTETIKKKILSKYQNKCLTKTDLLNIQQEIQDYYLNKGFISTRVYLDYVINSQNQKELIFVINEGYLENIEFVESKQKKFKDFRNKTKIFTAFPFLKNKPLNIADIDQGIEQMNRLQSNNITMEVLPGTKDGYSKILLTNKKTKTISGGLKYDNLGSHSTGIHQTTVNISQDDILGMSDNIYISKTSDNENHGNYVSSKSYYTKYSIPFGYWDFSASISESKYLISSFETNLITRFTGQSLNQAYKANKVIKRTSKYKLNLDTELDIKKTEAFVNDVRIEANTKRLTIGGVGFSYYYYPSYQDSNTRGALIMSVKYNKGLEWFNATNDPNENLMSPGTTHTQFDKISFTATNNQGFYVFQKPLTLKTNINAQYSYDELYSSERISTGGLNAVRGFKQSSIEGDTGYVLRNDLEIKTIELLNLNNKYFNKTLLGTFYDYGYATPKADENHEEEGYMSGTGFFIKYFNKYIDWNLTYSKSLHTPQRLDKEGESIYFDIKIKF